MMLKLLDSSFLTTNKLSPSNFHLILCTFTFAKLTAIFVYSSIISSNIFYSFFAHQLLASTTYATLSERFSNVKIQT